MRIFFAAPSTAHQTCLPGSRLWEANLYHPLIDLGHEVIVFNFDYTEFNYNLDPSVPRQRRFISRNRPRFGEELLRQIDAELKRGSIDLFFSYFYSSYVEPAVIRAIRAKGMMAVNWYCNGSYQFNLVEEIAPAYDYCLVPEKFRMADYRRVGATPIYCQEAANPDVYKPYDLPREYDVTFVGQRYGNRPQYIAHLAKHGIDVRAWGPHWDSPPRAPRWVQAGRKVKDLLGLAQNRGPHDVDVPLEICGPPLADEELVKMYSRSRISLGFSSVNQTPAAGERQIKQVRLRDFEATMSGAFYLVEHFDELEDFFEPGKEIETFADAAELEEKVRFYLKHPAERERIRLAGMRRARAEHTWQQRFQSVFKQIGLS